MFIARWSISAKFGHKQKVVDLMQRWMRDIAPQAGVPREGTRMLTGSIGALEATIQTEHTVGDLAELQSIWDKLAKIDAHAQWGKELEPFVVSGTSRWEIFRLL